MPLPLTDAKHYCHSTAVNEVRLDTMPLSHYEKSESSLTVSISLSIPVILPSRMLFLLNCFLSAVSHLEPEGHISELSVVGASVSHFTGHQKDV